MGVEEMEWTQTARGQEDSELNDAAVSTSPNLHTPSSFFPDFFLTRTDYVLTQDKSFKKYAQQYAKDEELFFKEYGAQSIPTFSATHSASSFSAVVAKLFELGVPPSQWATSEPWLLQTLDEQKK